MWRKRHIWIYPDHAESEISPVLNEASSAAEKSILPIARLIPRHADAIYRVNFNVRGTQHGQNHFGNVIRIEWAAAVHLCSMEGEGRDPAPGVCYCKAALLRFPSAGILFLFFSSRRGGQEVVWEKFTQAKVSLGWMASDIMWKIVKGTCSCNCLLRNASNSGLTATVPNQDSLVVSLVEGLLSWHLN